MVNSQNKVRIPNVDTFKVQLRFHSSIHLSSRQVLVQIWYKFQVQSFIIVDGIGENQNYEENQNHTYLETEN